MAVPKADTPVSPAPDTASGPSACIGTFAERGGVALASPAGGGSGECGVEDPVTFRDMTLPDGSKVELESAVTLRCAFALEVLAWVRDDLSAIAARQNGKLSRLVSVGGHACRPRNGTAGARISEHASGNALDLGALRMQDGRTIAMTGSEASSRVMRDAIRKSACDRFTTVLGPGSDASHKDHLHLDLRRRPRGYRICQWAVD